MLLALSDSNPTEGGENQRPQTSLIEAQLKHANALILFSLVVLLGLWRIIWFFFFFFSCMHGITLCEPSWHVFPSADASTSTSLWAIIWGGVGGAATPGVYFGRNPIMHPCPFALVCVSSPACHRKLDRKRHLSTNGLVSHAGTFEYHRPFPPMQRQHLKKLH